MKKLILVAVMAIISGGATAQKLEKPKIDKMTGDTTLKTSEERIYTSLSWSGGETDILYSYTMKYKGSKFLVFHINVTNGKRSSVLGIGSGAKAYLKLLDGTIVEMAISTSQVSDNQVFSGTMGLPPNTRGDVFPFFELNSDLKSKLTGSSIKMIRFETSNGNMDFDIKDKNGKIIGKQIELID